MPPNGNRPGTKPEATCFVEIRSSLAMQAMLVAVVACGCAKEPTERDIRAAVRDHAAESGWQVEGRHAEGFAMFGAGDVELHDIEIVKSTVKGRKATVELVLRGAMKGDSSKLMALLEDDHFILEATWNLRFASGRWVVDSPSGALKAKAAGPTERSSLVACVEALEKKKEVEQEDTYVTEYIELTVLRECSAVLGESCDLEGMPEMAAFIEDQRKAVADRAIAQCFPARCGDAPKKWTDKSLDTSFWATACLDGRGLPEDLIQDPFVETLWIIGEMSLGRLDEVAGAIEKDDVLSTEEMREVAARWRKTGAKELGAMMDGKKDARAPKDAPAQAKRECHAVTPCSALTCRMMESLGGPAGTDGGGWSVRSHDPLAEDADTPLGSGNIALGPHFLGDHSRDMCRSSFEVFLGSDPAALSCLSGDRIVFFEESGIQTHVELWFEYMLADGNLTAKMTRSSTSRESSQCIVDAIAGSTMLPGAVPADMKTPARIIASYWSPKIPEEQNIFYRFGQGSRILKGDDHVLDIEGIGAERKGMVPPAVEKPLSPLQYDTGSWPWKVEIGKPGAAGAPAQGHELFLEYSELELLYCHALAGAGAGNIVVEVAIGTQGKLEKVGTKSSTLSKPEAEACITGFVEYFVSSYLATYQPGTFELPLVFKAR